MLAIKNNIMAGNAARHLGKAYDGLARSVERLASGLRINSAKDDAAGLAVRELIRADVAVLQQGSRNAQDGISMLQTMEGAMAVIDDNLIRMKEVAEQAATGSYSSDQRTIMNAEFAEMAAEIDRIAGATSFNGIRMLTNADGTDAVDIHVGTTETISVARQNMLTASSGLDIEVGSAGWSATQLLANGMDTTTDTTFIQLTDDGGSTKSLTMTLQFTDSGTNDDEAAIAFNLTAEALGSTQGTSMEDVRDAINLVSQNLSKKADGTVQAYAAAEIIRDANGKYQLKVNSRTSTADAMTFTVAGFTGTAASTAAGWFDETTGSIMNAGNWTNAAGVTGSGINISTAANAATALTAIGLAITEKDQARAAFGYKMNRLESTISILDVQSENLLAAESRISDVDVATEMATLTRTQVLSQAGIAMLAQANSMPQMALTLLR
ncbi:MAG: hypothetical protein GWO86_00480 [Planctomycetes bacterium]|nr:hypothetical protein [Planctomycetota bacterium]